MTRVLVTGGTGFVGQHALRLLVEAGHEVHAVHHTAAPSADPSVRWRQADLLDPRDVARLVDDVRPTHLLHLAWFGVPGEFWHTPENLRWTEASLRLLRVFAAADGRRAVLAGTCAEYDWEHALCSEADTPLLPRTLYGACKQALHAVAEPFAAQSGITLAWGRIFFVYGPREHPARFVPSVVRALLRGKEAPCSHGRQIRDFMHAADVASAFVRLLESDVQGAVNVASGIPVSVGDLAFAIGDAIGRRDLIRLGEIAVAPDEPLELVADTRRLRDEVGWQPAIQLEQGLAETIGWWRRELAHEQGAAA
jgi:nucleoside-diphosphate-sugar epimerase